MHTAQDELDYEALDLPIKELVQRLVDGGYFVLPNDEKVQTLEDEIDNLESEIEELHEKIQLLQDELDELS